MSNVYGLPEDALIKIRERDTECVYCHKEMTIPKNGDDRRNWATIEHMNDQPPFNDPTTVAICCGSCNSSRGVKKLLIWFESPYCKQRNISFVTVAGPVKKYITEYEM